MSGAERGSVFVEALTATAIVAAVTAAMLTTVGQAGARRQAVETRRAALMVARSQLAAVGAAVPVRPGQLEGADGDFVWRVTVEPWPGDNAGESLAGSLELVSVAVRPAAGGEDLAVLETLRLAPAP
jgi:hypothetical protein